MALLQTLKLQTKLLCAFLLVSLIALSLGLTGTLKMRLINDADTFLYERVTVPLGEISDIAVTFQRVRINLRDALESTDKAETAAILTKITQFRERISQRMDSFEKTIISEEARKDFAELKQARQEYLLVLERILDLNEAGKKDEARTLIKGEGRNAAQHYQQMIDKLIESKEKQGEMLNQQTGETADTASRMMFGFMAAGFLASIGLGILITRNIQKQLGEDPGYLHQVAKSLAAGNLDGPFLPARSENSVYSLMLGIVSSMRKQLAFSQGVMNGVAVPFSVYAAEDTLLFTNQAMLDVMEISGTPESHYGKQSGEYIYGEKGRETVSSQALKEHRTITRDRSVQTRSGKTRHVRISSSPFFDDSGSELGTVAIWLDQTDAIEAQQTAEQAVADIKRAADQLEKVVEIVTSASEELSAQIEQSSHGAEEQSSRIAETATAMEEMNATVLEVARNAQQAAETSDNARQQAQEGAQVVGNVVSEIGQVREQSQALKADMAQLGKQAEAIGQIMNVISDIADQTNLLALNAAIEAARAGDAGRGFAVVADEVRKLAEKTMAATKEVGDAIQGIQHGTRKNMENVDRSALLIDDATSLASRSGEALQRIVALVDQAGDQVRVIASASEQQSATSDEINRSVEHISVISTETAQAMGQAAQAVSDLAHQSHVLHTLIKEMKTNA